LSASQPNFVTYSLIKKPQKLKSMKSIHLNFRNLSQLALAGIFVAAFTLASCNKKDDDNTDPGGGDNPPTDNPMPQMGSGTLVAIKTQNITSTPIGDVTTTIGLGVAVFTDDAYNSFTDAGTVELKGNALTKHSNNSYAFTPSLTNPTGIDLSGSITWDVSGNGNIPSFSHTVNTAFPSVGAVTSSSDVSKSGYTLTVASVNNADSVYFQVGSVLKVLPGNAVSCQFTADDLSSLSTGASIVQVAPIKISSADYSGKTFYFINESTSSVSANISN
jgi:hypothetical protein